MLEDLALSVAEYYCKKNNKFLKSVGGGIDNLSANYLSQQIISVVKKHSKVVMAAGCADAIPGGATVAITAIIASTWKMYYDINKCLGISFSENFLKSVASGIVSNIASNGVGVAAHAGANLLSFIPVVGNIAALAGGVAANRASIYTAAVSYLKILEKVAKSGGTLNEDSFKQYL
mgnify:CR=1 FL=1